MEFSNLDTSYNCPVFSPCSTYFAITNNNNVYIKQTCFDLKNHSQIQIKQLKGNQSSKNSYPLIKFSPNSKLIALQFTKKIEIYDILGNLKIRIQDPFQEIQVMIWTKDSSQIMVFYTSVSNISIYHIFNQTQVFIKNFKLANQNCVAFSKGQNQGKLTAVLQKHNSKDSIGIYFTSTWQLVNHFSLDTFDAIKVQFSQNGYIIVYENKINFKIFIMDIYNGVIQSYGNKDYSLGVCCSKFSCKSNFLALGAHDDCIHLMNTQTWKVIAEIQMTGQIDTRKTIHYRQESEGKFNKVCVGKIKIQKINPQKKQSQSGVIPGISILEFSPNDGFLCAKIDTIPNCVFIYNTKKLQLVSVIELNNGQIRDLKWLKDENEGQQNEKNVLCIAYGKSSLLMWREDSEGLFEIEIPSVNNGQLSIGRIEMGRDGKLIFYSNSMRKYVFAIKNEGSELYD